MIRDYKNQDLNRIMELWLDTNISAHSFIGRDYWTQNFDAVEATMPDATIYVYEKDGIIQAFVGLINNYIAGIFVSAQLQSRGIGKTLLDYAKAQMGSLSLSVYQKNSRAVNFYLRENFIVEKICIDENTGETELAMSWSR